jgi:O-antigen/teichoic acid export membrane protein
VPFRRQSIFQGAAATMAVQLMNLALAYLVTVTLARLLDPRGFGVYSFVLALVGIAVLPAQMGLPALIVREVAKASITATWDQVKGLLIRSHQIAISGSVLLAALLGAAFYFLPHLTKAADLRTVGWGLLLMPLLALAGLRSAMVRGLRRTALGQLPDQIAKPVCLLLMLYVAAAQGFSIDPASAMAFNIAATLVSALIGYLIFIRVWPFNWRSVVARYQTPLWLASIVPLGLTSAISNLNAQAGTALLGFFQAPEDVGHYRVASQIAQLTGFVYIALNAVMFPWLARAHAALDKARMERLAVIGARVATLASTLALMVMVFAGDHILSLLFGPDYAPATQLAIVLTLSSTINSAFGFAAAVLNTAHQERTVARAFVLSALLNIALTIILITPLGAMGAAWSAVLTSLLLNLILRREARKILQVETAFWGHPRR